MGLGFVKTACILACKHACVCYVHVCACVVGLIGAYSGQSTFVELPPEFYSFDVSFLCNRLAIRLTAKPAGTPLFAAAGAEDPAAVAAAAAASCTGARAAAAAAAATAAATETLGDVELPGWCEGDPALLLLLHRAALESSNCSSALHRWIDLIFGYKQTGQVGFRLGFRI